jgi:hypothetical protein
MQLKGGGIGPMDEKADTDALLVDVEADKDSVQRV